MAYSATKLLSMGLSGGENLVAYDISPDAATGSVTFSDYTEVYPVAVIPLTEDSASGAQIAVQAKENGAIANKVDFKLWSAANTAATAFKDFRVLLKTVT